MQTIETNGQANSKFSGVFSYWETTTGRPTASGLIMKNGTHTAGVNTAGGVHRGYVRGR